VTIHIVGDDGQIGLLLDAAAIVQNLNPPSALVGGVAVICRLAAVHRITLDADTVVEQSDTDIVEILTARADTTQTDARTVLIGGAKVEIIDVGPVDPAVLADQVDDNRERLFVAAHRWALDTAETIEVDTYPPSRVRRLAVAIPPALAATKTHALVGRRPGGEEKAGSDLTDIVALFEMFDRDGELTGQLHAAPYDLGQLVAGQLAGFLGDPQRRTRAVGLARQHLGSAMTLERIETALAHVLSR